MFGRLLPRETSFFDFFENHAAKTVEGAEELLSLASTGANIGAKAKRIKEIEHECDTITHHCVEALHKTFITPIERDDIYRLITRMDDIMDFVEAAAERLALYKLEKMTPELKDLADVLVRSTKELAEALKLLRNLEHTDAIVKKCIDVNRLENEADAILRRSVARLFKDEKDPITVIKWKDIYETMETVTDRCEDAANVLQNVIVKMT